jgi:hypothetical protein
MGRHPWIALLPWVALLLLAACGGAETDTPTVTSPPTRLFLAGDGELTVVDVDAGRAERRPLAELAPGDPPYRIVRRGNELVLYGGATYVLDSALRSPPRKLGDSWFFIPAAEPDRVWLALLDPASPETVRALAGVREVTVDGRVTVQRVRTPGGRWPLAEVGDVLVFEDRRGGLELWRPATGEFTRRLPGAIGPSQGDLLAWCEDEGRILHVTDVRTGSERAVEPPRDFTAFDCSSGAFSPDGTSLAIPALVAGFEAGRLLTLVDLESGSAEAVEESAVADGYVHVAWSSGGDRVFVSGGRGRARELLQYRLGDPEAVRVPVEVRDFYGMAAT